MVLVEGIDRPSRDGSGLGSAIERLGRVVACSARTRARLVPSAWVDLGKLCPVCGLCGDWLCSTVRRWVVCLLRLEGRGNDSGGRPGLTGWAMAGLVGSPVAEVSRVGVGGFVVRVSALVGCGGLTFGVGLPCACGSRGTPARAAG